MLLGLATFVITP